MIVRSWLQSRWMDEGVSYPLFSAITGEQIGVRIEPAAVDHDAVCRYAREVGGPALQRMGTIHDRAFAIKRLAQHLLERKEFFYSLSTHTGATRRDSWIDIEGGIGAMFVLSSKARRELTDGPMHVEGSSERLSRGGSFIGQHVCVTRPGVAVLLNAFNFPIWGLAEKLAPSIIAGMPVLIKPAPSGSWLAHAFVECMLESGILPEGAVQFLSSDIPEGLLDVLGPMDHVLFTGSAPTGRAIRSHPAIIDRNVRLNIEADSLNATILGPDVEPEDEEFSAFIREVIQEMTVKSGQKCTAIRRVIVPERMLAIVREGLEKELKALTIGDPAARETKMGPLASSLQARRFAERLGEIEEAGGIELLFETPDRHLSDSAFVNARLMLCRTPLQVDEIHRIEAFGPMASLLPYNTLDEAIDIANRAEGSLVCSCFTTDSEVARRVVDGCAPWHGRVHVIDRRSAGESTGHGSPMPHMVHGGPGRAGGGEEQGGARAVLHMMQRTALQGSPTMLMHTTGTYLKGADTIPASVHPFRMHFEDLKPGLCWDAGAKTITPEDVEAFGELSGDRFYAHFNDNAAREGLFGRRVAHGYLVLSASAGMFVDPDPGPVLLNYGLENLQFHLPVDFGDTIHTRLIVRRKTRRQRRLTDKMPYGIVYWDVEVRNQRHEIVADYTILTLVERRDRMRWDET